VAPLGCGAARRDGTCGLAGMDCSSGAVRLPVGLAQPLCHGWDGEEGFRGGWGCPLGWVLAVGQQEKECLSWGGLGVTNGPTRLDEDLRHEVNYYAHTAVRSEGTPDRNPAKWQLLSTHLRGRRSSPTGVGPLVVRALPGLEGIRAA